ncbi:tautomerase family protein, partial [Oenococcus oeni]
DITAVMVKDTKAKPEAVHIVVREFEANHYALGGVLKSDM